MRQWVSQEGGGMSALGVTSRATWTVRWEPGPSQVSVAVVTQRWCSGPAGSPGGLAAAPYVLAAVGGPQVFPGHLRSSCGDHLLYGLLG